MGFRSLWRCRPMRQRLKGVIVLRTPVGRVPVYKQERAHEEIRHGCLELLGGLCTAGAGALWREGAFGAEEAVRLCLALVDDPAQVG